ncbi:MAG TPA: glycoside hydrolase family 3 C-terminal domain-containing protein [Bryobacteraceae bacterium]|nr:glycoside hydrolase family 3 C-terminal domain-containing protein [Bryobacteraceae bacterium]
MKVHLGLAAIALALPFVAGAQQPAYLNPNLPIEQRIDDLIPRLTLQEKADLLGTTAPAIDRLKIPVMNGWNQSLHGIVWTEPTTMFPVNIAMAATWNPALIQQVAGVIADEGRAIYNYWPTVTGTPGRPSSGQVVIDTPDGKHIRHNGLVYRSPVINISRDPRWGRIVEAFGEDTLLDSRMTVAYVKGTQGDDPRYLKLAATLKHYAVYNQERGRQGLNAIASERMLMEFYLPHFKAGIVEGHAQSIMSSYNALNGVPNSENKLLLMDILRDQWKFDGFVVPDSGAVQLLVNSYHEVATMEEAAAKTILAGSDLDNGLYPRTLATAVQKGFLKESDLDQSLRRVLRVRYRLGEFDPPSMVPYSKISPSIIDSAPNRALTLKTAHESIVLLTNKNNFLPLDKSKLKTIAVIGPHADFAMLGIGYTGLASNFIKPIDGIRNKVGAGVQVLYAKGCNILDAPDKDASFAEAVNAAKKADVAIVYAGLNNQLEAEGRDRPYLGLPPVQEELIKAVYAANPRTVLVLLNGGPVSVRWEKDNLPAVVDMFYGGETGGDAVADVLFGDYNPGGRLPYTVYESTDQIPPMNEYDITKGFTYMYFEGQPVYPFGHGLSYTSFKYSNLRLSTKRMRANGTLTVRVDVQNTGKRAGDEVAQLYVHDVAPVVKRPIKQLQGFERVSLNPGQKKTVTFTVPAGKLAYWDETTHAFVVVPEKEDVMVGASSADIRLKDQFEVVK